MFVGGSDLYSQTIKKRGWLGLSDGLSSNKVSRIVQDSIGFFWVKTPEGIDRYDGLRFKNYHKLNSSPVVLLDNIHHSIHTKGESELWLFGRNSVQVLDTQKDSILYQKKWPKGTKKRMSKFINGKFWIFLQSKDSTYLLRHRGQFEFDTIFLNSLGIESEQFIINSHNVLYYFNKKAHFLQYDIKNQQTTLLDSITYTSTNLPNKLRMFFDSKERIWVFNRWWTPKEPSLAYWEKDRFHLLNIPKLWLRKEGRKNEDEVYLKDMNNYSVYLLNCKTEKLTFLHQLGKHSKILLTDQLENFWISNQMDGFKRISLSADFPFQNYFTTSTKTKTPIIAMRHLAELPNGDILISTNNGLYRHSRERDSIINLNYTNLRGRSENPHQAYRLHYDETHNSIWISQTRGVTNYIDHSLDILKEQKRLIPRNQIVLFWKEDKVIWLLGKDKLYPIELEKVDYTEKEWPIPPQNLDIYHFFKSRNGQFWLATNKGLYHYDVDGSFIEHIDSKHHLFPLNSSIVYDIWESQSGILWLATHAGLHRLDIESSEIKIYTRKNGLCNNIICSILEDDQANLWLGTFNGLSLFDPSEQVFNNFYEEDGLPSNEFNISSRLKASDGRLYFGGIRGLTAFYPQEINRLQKTTPLVLTKYSTYSKDGKELREQEKDLSKLKAVQLPYNNKLFRFEFALLNYINPEKNTYSWFLEGFEEGWKKPSKYAEAQYNNIPAGDYTFRLRAADYSGVWSENQIAIKVHIQQAFYKTIWFVVSIAILFMSVLYTWYRYRLHQVLVIENMRNKIARDLHDDIGGALTRLSIQSQLLESKLDNPKSINNFSTVLIQTISKLRDVVWSIDSGHDKFEDLLDRMKDYVYDTLHPKDISYHFDIQKLDSNKKLTPAFRQNIYLIFKESINNIIRHSKATAVHIVIKNKVDGKFFEMQIKDNGSNALIKKSSGLGLKSMQRRANDLDGRLDIESSEKGFIVRLVCPMV